VIVNPRYATQECERAPETAKAAFCDEVSGLRYYNPTEGRWLSRDPIEEQGGVNIYAFVRNRPITDIDSLGEDFIAVGTRVLNGWLGTFGGTAMPSNHMSIEYYYCCAKEGQEFTAGDPPNGTTRAGARELLEESSYSRVIKGKHQTVAISFIYTTSHARDLVVIYAEADADKKWKARSEGVRLCTLHSTI
jgi:RHS repeat-associated protein